MNDIATIRSRIAHPGTLAEQGSAFVELLLHPDLAWKDLIDALQWSGMISEMASLELHRKLGIPIEDSNMNLDPNSWRRVLEAKGIEVAAICGRPATLKLLKINQEE